MRHPVFRNLEIFPELGRPGFSPGGRQTATVQLPKKVLDYFPTAPTLYLQTYRRAIVYETVAAPNAVTRASRCARFRFAVEKAASTAK